MSGLDASFYLLEDENTPLHVAMVVVFEGPPPAYEELVRAIRAKLPQIPRYRQRVRSVPLHLGRPVWADDPHFNIYYHVRHAALPAPGTDEQLRNLAGQVLAQRLDRAKPLWEISLVEGMRDGRWALIAKVHHCMVDGVAGIDLATVLLDLTPDYRPPIDIEPWRPDKDPSALGLVADSARHGVLQPLRSLRTLPGLAGTALRQPGQARTFASGVARGTVRFFRRSAGSLNGPIGPHRRWCWVTGDLEEIRAIRRAFGGTVNDVVLAAVANGFRELLAARGELAEDTLVRSAVPVSLRDEAVSGVLENRVAAYFVNLPVGRPDPLVRLRLVREQMADVKGSRQEISTQTISRLADAAVAPALLTLAARFPVRLFNPMVQTVTTNVPGPQFPLYVLGRRVLEMHPYVPLTGAIRVATAIVSYCGKLHFGISADYDAMPDLDVLSKGIRSGFDELLVAATAQGPGQAATRGRTAPTSQPTRSG